MSFIPRRGPHRTRRRAICLALFVRAPTGSVRPTTSPVPASRAAPTNRRFNLHAARRRVSARAAIQCARTDRGRSRTRFRGWLREYDGRERRARCADARRIPRRAPRGLSPDKPAGRWTDVTARPPANPRRPRRRIFRTARSECGRPRSGDGGAPAARCAVCASGQSVTTPCFWRSRLPIVPCQTDDGSSMSPPTSMIRQERRPYRCLAPAAGMGHGPCRADPDRDARGVVAAGIVSWRASALRSSNRRAGGSSTAFGSLNVSDGESTIAFDGYTQPSPQGPFPVHRPRAEPCALSARSPAIVSIGRFGPPASRCALRTEAEHAIGAAEPARHSRYWIEVTRYGSYATRVAHEGAS